MITKNRLLNIFSHYINIGADSDIKRNSRLLAMEGMFLTILQHFANGNFSLYATRLGASDFQLSLVSSLPPLIGLLILIPGAIFIDRMNSKKIVVTTAILTYGVIYFFISLAPFFGDNAIIFFLVMLPLASIPSNVYNASWQSYFFDIIPIERRNNSYTMRTMLTFTISLTLPLITGQILARSLPEQKIHVHQILLAACFFVSLAQVYVFSKTKTVITSAVDKPPVTVGTIGQSVISVFTNKNFLLFLIPMLLFHMSWHMDWSLHFLTQIRYFGANEAWLSYIAVCGNLIQFICIRLWSKLNQRRGVRFTIIFGAYGFALYALLVVFNLLVPQGFALWFNLGSFAVFSSLQVAFTLCAFQALLEVIPRSNTTLNISVYNVLILISNCIMPVAGVKLYSALGGDRWAMVKCFLFIFFFRIIGATGIFLRWKLYRGKSIETAA